jgi:hypothetical protein
VSRLLGCSGLGTIWEMFVGNRPSVGRLREKLKRMVARPNVFQTIFKRLNFIGFEALTIL